MKNKKCLITIIIVIMVSLLYSSNVLAVTDEVKHFLSTDFSSTIGGPATTNRMVQVFNNLGYNNVSNNNTGGYETITNILPVYQYIQESGHNYGLSFFGHGYNGEQISVVGGGSIGPENCSGNWHLVILNACSSGATSDFADALHITGYSNRGFVGWFNTIQVVGLNEWSGHFVGKVCTESIRMAHLHAANLCVNSTPARFFGDTSWYGYSWN